MKLRDISLAILVLASLAFSAAVSGIQSGLCLLFNQIQGLFGIVIFLLIIAAAVVYAGGQILGAETRARATVWATSMFMGAIIGVALYLILPIVLRAMMGGTISACGTIF